MFIKSEGDRIIRGGAYIELQFCHLEKGTPIEQIVAVDSISHWKSDSLYLSDENEFCLEYGNIFDCGVYNNLQTGTVDPYGINYYSPEATACILQRVIDKKPTAWETLSEWLESAKEYNGFYILGI